MIFMSMMRNVLDNWMNDVFGCGTQCEIDNTGYKTLPEVKETTVVSPLIDDLVLQREHVNLDLVDPWLVEDVE